MDLQLIFIFFVIFYLLVTFLVFFSLNLCSLLYNRFVKTIFFLVRLSKNKYFRLFIIALALVCLGIIIFNIFVYSWLDDVIKLSNIESIRADIESRTLKKGETLIYKAPTEAVADKPDSIFIKVMKRSGFWDLHRVVMLKIKHYKEDKSSRGVNK